MLNKTLVSSIFATFTARTKHKSIMTAPKTLTQRGWEDYELIDCGDFEKLERFGAWITIRPEPQAIWTKTLSESEWQRLASATFRRGGQGGRDAGAGSSNSAAEERGEWSCRPEMPKEWWISYQYKEMKMRLKLALTPFKHVGIFPEQASNWNFIYDSVKKIERDKESPAQVLNLFAYTGAATLAARSAGAEVTHIDSIKQIVGWARENAEQNGLEDIRWIVEDALKFARREVKRGRVYDGIIMDPPAYGRGPSGENWVLERDLTTLLKVCSQLLAPQNSFLLLNLYSLGFSPQRAKRDVHESFGSHLDVQVPHSEEFGELHFDDRSGRSLLYGVYYRFLK